MDVGKGREQDAEALRPLRQEFFYTTSHAHLFAQASGVLAPYC